MTVAVITAIYGGFDDLVAPPPQTVDADWIAVTDDPAVADTAANPHPWPWEVVVDARPDLTARMAAKVPKCRPDRWTDADTVVWIDGSCRLKNRHSLETLLARSADAPLLAQFAHPDRTCALVEAEFSSTIPKYEWQPILDQRHAYAAAGLPGGWGLWATGLIVRRRSQAMREFGDAWLAEQMRWTDQDQVSEPYVLWKLGLRPTTIPGNLWVNDTHAFFGHARPD